MTILVARSGVDAGFRQFAGCRSALRYGDQKAWEKAGGSGLDLCLRGRSQQLAAPGEGVQIGDTQRAQKAGSGLDLCLGPAPKPGNKSRPENHLADPVFAAIPGTFVVSKANENLVRVYGLVMPAYPMDHN